MDRERFESRMSASEAVSVLQPEAVLAGQIFGINLFETLPRNHSLSADTYQSFWLLCPCCMTFPLSAGPALCSQVVCLLPVPLSAYGYN